MDLADGTFSQATIDAFNAAVIDLGMSPVAGNLDADALLAVQGAINNVPEPAEFDGLDATIPNDQAEPLTGNVTVTDVNFGEDKVTPQTDVQTAYGTFSIEESGAWTYLLDTENPEVAGHWTSVNRSTIRFRSRRSTARWPISSCALPR